jgi:hypothetical protein
MDQGLLVREQIDGGQKLVEQLVQNGFPLTTAFWRKDDDDTRWYLHLVTPIVEEQGPFEAYRQVRAAVQGCQWVDPEEAIDTSVVKVLETTHPLAKLVGEIARRNPGPFNTWVRAEWVRDGAVSGTYIYARLPSQTSVPAN